MAPTFTITPRPAAATVLHLALGESMDTGEGIRMTVNRQSYPAGTPVETVLAGTAVPETVYLTQDGRGADLTRWHQGPSADQVFVERWDAQGRAFHGWVDVNTRQLVQAG